MAKIINSKTAVSFFKSGQSVMIGGFLNCGSPTLVIDELLNTDITDLTLIANDTGTPDYGRGKLIVAKKIKIIIKQIAGTAYSNYTKTTQKTPEKF